MPRSLLLRRTCAFLLSTVCGGAFSGCVLERLWEVHRQLYAEAPLIVVNRHPGAPIGVTFRQPCLLERDVDWLVEERPTRRVPHAGGSLAHYRLLQEGRPIADASALDICVRYVARDGQFKLAEIVLPPAFAKVLTPEVLEAAAAAWKIPATDPLRRQLKLDLAAFRDLQMPHRHEIESVLGPPNRARRNGATWLYRSLITRPDGTLGEAHRVIRLGVRFERDGRVCGIEADYGRYRFRADIAAGQAVVAIR